MLHTYCTLLILRLLVVVQSCPFLRPTSTPTSPSQSIGNGAFCRKTNGALLVTDSNKVCFASKSIVRDFFNLNPANNENLKSLILGKVVRLAFHDAGEYDQNSVDNFGSDGCLSTDPQNVGLVEDTSIVNTLFEPIWQEYCDHISRADFWALIAAVAIEAAEPNGAIRITKLWGRTDNKECTASDRLPSGKRGLTELERVIVSQMGLTLTDAGGCTYMLL